MYAAFAAANTQPRRSYDEGAAFPGVAPVAVNRLTAGSPHADFTTRLNHLTAKTVPLPARLAEVEEVAPQASPSTRRSGPPRPRSPC